MSVCRFKCTRCQGHYEEQYSRVPSLERATLFRMVPDFDICHSCRRGDEDAAVQMHKAEVALVSGGDGFMLLMAEMCALRDHFTSRLQLNELRHWQRVLENLRKLKEDGDGKASS